ncbi:MAG: chorismate mutase [SAR202 cluster bacterium]|nr:chorismate mutase [SAR202 cluster bacterium]
MSHCLGLRGATTADANTRDAILDATEELLRELLAANHVAEDDIAAIFLTTTTDLTAEFPAVAARVRLGLERTALMSSHEIPVPGSTPSVIRALLLVNTSKRKDELKHLYLKGAANLRARGLEKA